MIARILLMGLLLGCGALGGCGHELFTDANNGNGRGIEKYYDGDSAVQEREKRRKTSEMGFGYPAGMLQQ